MIRNSTNVASVSSAFWMISATPLKAITRQRLCTGTGTVKSVFEDPRRILEKTSEFFNGTACLSFVSRLEIDRSPRLVEEHLRGSLRSRKSIVHAVLTPRSAALRSWRRLTTPPALCSV